MSLKHKYWLKIASYLYIVSWVTPILPCIGAIHLYGGGHTVFLIVLIVTALISIMSIGIWFFWALGVAGIDEPEQMPIATPRLVVIFTAFDIWTIFIFFYALML